jgi:CRISPR-associated protein Cas5t
MAHAAGETTSAPETLLSLARYRVTLEALEPLDLPAYLGSTLRGAFGHAFRKLCCPGRADEPCPIPTSCPLIHGHCASMLGRWPDPATFRFGLHFTFRSVGVDLEHQHLTEVLGPRARQTIPTVGGALKATATANIQPVRREFLFDTALTLYLNPEMADAFRAPVYPVVLGRSQDLAEVISVDVITLRRGERARLEHTLLPWRLRPCVPAGTTVLLSRYISEAPRRDAEFDRFVGLHDPVFVGGEPTDSRTALQVQGIEFDGLWVDPEHVDDDGFERGIWIHALREAS